LKRPAHLFVENFVQFSKVYLVAGEMNHLSRQLFKYTTLIAQSQQKLFLINTLCCVFRSNQHI
ncbi:hypothetical protein, partial [Lentilactobacillus buchneri]|uniref:hypothetical protein n=1 Tax=Lentilactobacillus buchneri TaxID=1581 RepID=UPI0021A6C6F6